METVKNWVFSFCITAVIAAVVQMMVPKGNMEKIIKITVRIFLITVIVSPLIVNADFRINDEFALDLQTEQYTQRFKEETNRLVAQELSNQVENMILEALADIDVYPNEVEVFVNSTDEKSAEIAQIRIELKQNYKIKDSDIRYKVSRIATCPINVYYTEVNGVEG